MRLPLRCFYTMANGEQLVIVVTCAPLAAPVHGLPCSFGTDSDSCTTSIVRTRFLVQGSSATVDWTWGGPCPHRPNRLRPRSTLASLIPKGGDPPRAGLQVSEAGGTEDVQCIKSRDQPTHPPRLLFTFFFFFFARPAGTGQICRAGRSVFARARERARRKRPKIDIYGSFLIL